MDAGHARTSCLRLRMRFVATWVVEYVVTSTFTAVAISVLQGTQVDRDSARGGGLAIGLRRSWAAGVRVVDVDIGHFHKRSDRQVEVLARRG